jgi:hypothetical protein
MLKMLFLAGTILIAPYPAQGDTWPLTQQETDPIVVLNPQERELLFVRSSGHNEDKKVLAKAVLNYLLVDRPIQAHYSTKPGAENPYILTVNNELIHLPTNRRLDWNDEKTFFQNGTPKLLIENFLEAHPEFDAAKARAMFGRIFVEYTHMVHSNAVAAVRDVLPDIQKAMDRFREYSYLQDFIRRDTDLLLMIPEQTQAELELNIAKALGDNKLTPEEINTIRTIGLKANVSIEAVQSNGSTALQFSLKYEPDQVFRIIRFKPGGVSIGN